MGGLAPEVNRVIPSAATAAWLKPSGGASVDGLMSLCAEVMVSLASERSSAYRPVHTGFRPSLNAA